STTIGNGNQTTGLTISGGATTTGTLLVQGNATTTNLALTGVLSTLLKTNSNGSIVPAVLGTDYQNFGYLFPNNATTTQLSFTGGASTTLLSVFTKAYFGGTSTTTIDSAGSVVLPSA